MKKSTGFSLFSMSMLLKLVLFLKYTIFIDLAKNNILGRENI